MTPTDSKAMPAGQTDLTPLVRKPRRKHPSVQMLVGGILLVGLVLAALLVPSVAGVGVDDQSREAYLGPSAEHLFGTDEVGRDVLMRSLHGLRLDLLLILIAVPVSMVIGTTLGMLRALNTFSGEVGQRVIDIILGFPAVILGICVAAIFGPGFWALLISLIVAGIPPFGRLARSSVLTIENRDFVLAARGFSTSRSAILWRHHIPNAVPVLLTQLAISFVGAIMLEASLSVIGLGLQPPTPTLGGMISSGLRNIYAQPWYVIGPTILLVLLTIALSLFADGVKERTLRP